MNVSADETRRTVLLIWVFMSCVLGVGAADLFVDSTLLFDCTSGSYSAEYRDCSGSDGNAYDTLQEALDLMSGGDDIFIRGGTYIGQFVISGTADGTPSNWSSLQSYPGEWAILDANGLSDREMVLGFESYAKTRDGDSTILEYFRIERLEITGSGRGVGLFLSGGPFIIRYCFIHDNLATSCGNNPAGIKGMIWRDTTVEYCWFRDNGCSSQPNERHSAAAVQIHTSYPYQTWPVPPTPSTDCSDQGVCDRCYQRNVYRYNLVEDTADRARHGFHDKDIEVLTPLDAIDWTRHDFGNEIHHNIIVHYARSAEGYNTNPQTIVVNNLLDDPPAGLGGLYGYRPITFGTYDIRSDAVYISSRTLSVSEKVPDAYVMLFGVQAWFDEARHSRQRWYYDAT